MQALAAGGDLDAMEQQVESGGAVIDTARVRVERARGQGEAEHEDGADAMFRFGQAAQRTLGLWIEIVDQIRASQARDALVEGPDRHRVHRRQRTAAVPRQGVAMRLVQSLEDEREQRALELDHVLRTVDEADLQVE